MKAGNLQRAGTMSARQNSSGPPGFTPPNLAPNTFTELRSSSRSHAYKACQCPPPLQATAQLAWGHSKVPDADLGQHSVCSPPPTPSSSESHVCLSSPCSRGDGRPEISGAAPVQERLPVVRGQSQVLEGRQCSGDRRNSCNTKSQRSARAAPSTRAWGGRLSEHTKWGLQGEGLPEELALRAQENMPVGAE